MKKNILLGLLLLSFGVQAQNVGVGTNTPAASAKLDVTSTNSGVLIPRVALTMTTAAGPVTAPANSLLVYNTATAGDVTPGFYYWSTTASAWIRLAEGAAGWLTTGNTGIGAANFLGPINGADLNFRTSNTQRVVITAAGDMGVGDATPAALFTVGNGDLFQVLSTGHTRTINGTVALPAYSFTGDPNTGMYHSALSDDMGFVTGGVQRMWISDAGEVYAGATAPVLPGDLFCATASNANAVTSGSGNLTWAVNGYTNFVGAGVYGLRLAGSGGTWGGVQGETSAANPLASKGVYGAAAATNHYGVHGVKPATGTGWGGLFNNDLGYTGFFGAASDASLKKDIKPLQGALNMLSQVELYSYLYKTDEYDVLGDPGELHYGVMAQELEKVIPSLVKTKYIGSDGYSRSGDESGETKDFKQLNREIEMVNYLELVPITIQAIKEQQEIIKSQQIAIEKLQKEVEALKKG